MREQILLNCLCVAGGGVVGALARYGLSFINQPGRPWGTLLVNIAGCLIMGFVARWIERGVISSSTRLFLGVGFLGALTTFSTFSYEILDYMQKRQISAAFIYIIASLFGAVAAVYCGYIIARLIWK
jgi:CrcB protein